MQRHSEETRSAVLAALLEGQGVLSIARTMNLPKSTVSNIKKELSRSELQGIDSDRQERLTDLIENHLRASLNAAGAIAEHVTDLEWLSGQNAADLAVLYGVLTDKSIRI